MATRRSNGFFVVQSRHQVGERERGEKKQPAGRSKVNVTHRPVCVCISKIEEKRKRKTTHLYLRIMAVGLNQSGLDKS